MRVNLDTKLKKRGIISLLTDFGTRDAYVGAMKGVLLGLAPLSTLVDISHVVTKHNILQGAFLLSQVSSYFPVGSVHLVVIDPGVGTSRRRVIIQGRRCFYVGPDNGVLSLAVKKEGIVKIINIENEKYLLPHPSRTFEGRDIFAPVAAHLANGVSVEEFGSEIADITTVSLKRPHLRGQSLVGAIIYIDSFGNLLTNFSENILKGIPQKDFVEITIGETSQRIPLYRTYAEVSLGSLLLISGSSGFLEVAVNQGRATKIFKCRVGDEVLLTL